MGAFTPASTCLRALCFFLGFLLGQKPTTAHSNSLFFMNVFPPWCVTDLIREHLPNAYSSIHLHKQNPPVQPAPWSSVSTAPQKPPVGGDHLPDPHGLCWFRLFFVLYINGTMWNVLFCVQFLALSTTFVRFFPGIECGFSLALQRGL